MANTYALELNGTSEYVTAASWKPTVFTLSGWIKPTAVNVYQVLVGFPNTDIDFYLDTDAKLHLRIWNGTSYDTFTSTGTISAGVYTFVACSYDSTSKAWAFYIGTGSTPDSSGTGTKTLFWDASASTLTTGSLSSGGQFYGGLIDDLRLWSAVRTGADLASDCSQELNGNEANLYGYYKFNNDLVDSDDTPHNGTGVDTPTFSTTVAFVWPLPSTAVSSNYTYFM